MGASAQVAGGVPAMCDGVPQGTSGMELSLFSRDVIAMATAVALSHDMFDAALMLEGCPQAHFTMAGHFAGGEYVGAASFHGDFLNVFQIR